ncbi:MAG: hypothetical protein AAGG47_14160 [Pseudomonadota bacterium]
MAFQYKFVGAPERGMRRRGTRTGSERIAAALQDLVMQHAQEGWEYLRTDTLPVSESHGLFGARRDVTRAVLVFRRAVRSTVVAEQPLGVAEAAPAPLATPEPATETEGLARRRPFREPSEPRREPALPSAPREAPREPEFRAIPPAPVPDDEDDTLELSEPQPPRAPGRPFRSPYRETQDAPPASPNADEPSGTERDPRDLSDIREALRKLDR